MMDRFGLGGGLHVCAALGLVGVALLLGRPVRRLARRRSIAERAAPLLHR
jgi:hypothetical protein